MPVAVLLVAMSLTCYRIARLLIDDTIIATPRIWLHTLLLAGAEKHPWKGKVQELLRCHSCLTVWISAGVVATVDQFAVVPLPFLAWPTVAAGAMMVARFQE